MGDMGKIVEAADDLAVAVVVPAEAYISPEYARAEQDKLWRKTWLQAGRVEDIPEPGNYVTFDILTDSVIIVRTGAQEIRAYANVCPHRGRRLVDVPAGKRNARGTRPNFICGYHGWTFGLDGKNSYVEHQEDWNGALCGRTDLTAVKVDTWGGWLWINLDPEAGPLRDYLEPAATMLEPYQLQNMRCALAQVGGLRLQLEGRDGGVLRDLSRHHHAPGIHGFQPVPRLGAQPGPPLAHRLRGAQGPRGGSRASCASGSARIRASRPRRCRTSPGKTPTPTPRQRWSRSPTA